MSRIITNNLRHNDATADNLTLDGTGNITAPGNLTTSGNLSVTGTTTLTNDLNVDSGTLFVDASTNRVGIGVTSPGGVLQVREGTDANLVFDTDGTETAIQAFNNAGSALAPLRLRASEIKLFTSSTERVRILSGGGLTFNGDTAAANALDDYEEGTWTPVFQYDSGGWSTVSFVSSPGNGTGSYVKIGNVVHFSYYSDSFQVATAPEGNPARIGGLPYSSYNDSSTYSGVLFYHTTAFQQTIHNGYVQIGNTNIYVIQDNSTSVATWSGASNRYLMVSGTYRTA